MSFNPRPKVSNGPGGGGGGGMSADDVEQDAAERNLIRRCVDFHNPAILDLNSRLYRGRRRTTPFLQPHSSQIRLMGLPIAHRLQSDRVQECFLTYTAHVTRSKNSSPVTCCSWTPGGRRLLTGNQEGEFTLWDGVSFNFELIMSAHDASFRTMAWSHHGNYLLTCDAGGNIKYWSPSIAPVQSIDAHANQAIHSLSFSPADTKFCSGGDDAQVLVWDWATHTVERTLSGHGWDVKACEWHPRSSVIASGSKDNVVKLWDPRTAECLSTLYGHKNTVTKVTWNGNGNWLLTSSRDQLIKLYDIRSMRELTSFKGHYKEVTSMSWHPLVEQVFCSGGMDGTLCFWNALGDCEVPQCKIPFAHDMAIWDVQWHPAGHMLASVSNDRQTKFWARNRVGSVSGLTTTDKENSAAATELVNDEIELGNHVGIVIGRRGQTIISMQRSTGTKMHVDQVRRTLLIEGTQAQVDVVRKRVHALLDRVSDHDQRPPPTTPQAASMT